MTEVGKKVWVVPEGYIPEASTGPEPEMLSHGTLCVLNAGNEDAQVEITIYFSDREPISGYQRTIPAGRTLHLRFNDLEDPEPVPRGTDFASVLRSDRPVVVQHTRLDSRQPANALMTTMAFPGE